MSIVDCASTDMGLSGELPLPGLNTPPMQRLGIVRRQQGVSCRTLARRMNVDAEEVRRQEQPECDLTLSALYAWQKALEVPVGELLVESDGSLATPVLERSQLLRLMKTVLAIRERAKQEPIRRMAETMIGQLIEIMPELEGVGAWHTVGQRRRMSELGVAAQRRLSDEVFIDRE